jgi:enediyne biosynthesis protein E4
MNKYLFLLLFVLAGCYKPHQHLFTKVNASYSRVDFINAIQDSKELNVLDYMYFYDGGGVSVGDINNDGLPDIYFTANKAPNKLYLNKGNFKFEDITQKAGVAGHSSWNTGTVMVDINGDGLLDIYVCAVTGILGFTGHNELFINQGDLTFKEESAKYKLNIQAQSANATFFDYDKDGDLDMYLLNQGHHSAASFGPASNRLKISEANGDRLLRNDNGVFVNVSQYAGIYSGPNSYGLGVAVADFNNDGWDDLYISNDFHEDDYYYINNKNGRFTEQLKVHFGKISRYSMGNDVADINHDAYPDIITLDMMPEDEKHLKSALDDNDPVYHKIRENLGYYPQFSRNMLQINHQGKYFTDVALYAGVAATDWSWAPLLADFNQDGEIDLFVTNGIYRRLNDLDYLKMYTTKAVKSKIKTSRLFDQKALELMPKASVHNYIFEGTNGLKFKDRSGKWIPNTPDVSSGAAFADFDNDGDLDLVVNNFNTRPSLLKNNSKNTHYLKIKLQGLGPNKFSIGAKVLAYNKGKLQLRQLYTTRGFQSSVEPIIHFGFGKADKIDSIRIIWPNNTTQVLTDVATNQTLNIKQQKNTQKITYAHYFKTTKPWFKLITDSIFTPLNHVENRFSEFSINPLLPYKLSTQGPAFAIGKGLSFNEKLIFFGGATRQKAQLFKFDSTGINPIKKNYFDDDSVSEDVGAVFFDADGDGDDDLFVVTSGNQFRHKAKPLQDRLYLNDGKNVFTKSLKSLPEYYENGAFVRARDIDNDGDIDLFIGGRVVAQEWNKSPKSYLLLNNGKAKYNIAKSVLTDTIGMLTDGVFTDFNNDGTNDLIVVGEWMAPQFYQNNHGHFVNVTKTLADINNTGLWQAIQPLDIDADGDIDYLLGNWGLNSKFKASKRFPLKMYVGDINGKGKIETFLSFAKNGTYYSINNKDELQKVLGHYIDSKFKTYKDFAGKSFDEIFDKKLQNRLNLKTVNNLSSGYLENRKGKFVFKSFDEALQLSPITSFLKYDFNNDGIDEVLLAGNFFGLPPYNGKFDTNTGYVLQQRGNNLSGIELGLNFGNLEIKHLKTVSIGQNTYLIVVVNNGTSQIYKILK